MPSPFYISEGSSMLTNSHNACVFAGPTSWATESCDDMCILMDSFIEEISEVPRNCLIFIVDIEGLVVLGTFYSCNSFQGTQGGVVLLRQAPKFNALSQSDFFVVSAQVRRSKQQNDMPFYVHSLDSRLVDHLKLLADTREQISKRVSTPPLEQNKEIDVSPEQDKLCIYSQQCPEHGNSSVSINITQLHISRQEVLVAAASTSQRVTNIPHRAKTIDSGFVNTAVSIAIASFVRDVNKYSVRARRGSNSTTEYDMSAYPGNDTSLVWWKIQQIISAMYSSSSVLIYGSYATGLWLPGQSDLDLLVAFQKQPSANVTHDGNFNTAVPLAGSYPVYNTPRNTNAQIDNSGTDSLDELLSVNRGQCMMYLYAIFSMLKTQPWCTSIKLISSAMPLIKLTASLRPGETIPVDISFLTPEHCGIQARDYVIRLTETVPLILRGVVLVVKRLLHQYNFNDVYSGGLGSYTLVLMVAFFLSRCGVDCDPQQLTDSPKRVRLQLRGHQNPVCTYNEMMSPEAESVVEQCVNAVETSTALCREWLQCHGGAEMEVEHIALFLQGFLQMFSPGGKGGLDLSVVGLSVENGGEVFLQESLPAINRGLLCIRDPTIDNKYIGQGSFNMATVQGKFAELHSMMIDNPSEFIQILSASKH